MTDTELQFIADSVREFVAERISAACAPLLLEIRDLSEQIRTLPVPVNGKDIDPELVRLAIASEITRQVDQLPKPKDGVNGKDGRDGADGLQGPAGPQGETISGAHGKDGLNGKDGRDGADVDMVQVRAMVDEIFEGYPVPKDGAPGVTGRDGKDADPELIRGLVIDAVTEAVAQIPAAAPGAPGRDADPIHPDTLRLMVVEAVREEIRAIPIPKDGDPGQHGRDSLEIDILPSIDPAKSYPRGTFACFEGGLIRAIRSTSPITTSIVDAGWAVVIEGFASPRITQQEDLRSFVIEFRATSGEIRKSEFRLPVLIYRGVRQSDVDYAIGDTVTWNGSVWHCEAESTRATPGTSPDWKLAVKHGERGKDLRATPEPPKPGPVVLK